MLVNRIILLCVSFLLFLAGCNNPMYNQTEANVADAAQRGIDLRHQSDASAKPVPPLVINQGVYVDQTPINLSKDPVWLKNRIILRGDQLPFSYYSRTIASGGGKDVLTHYQVGLDQAAQVSLNYSGSVRGALNLLAAKTGYTYTISGRHVYWQAFVTKTFDIAFMPGSSDYQMGKSSGGAAATTGGSGTNGAPTVSNIVDDNTAQEYSNLKGKLSVWQDLKDAITQMLSADGKVMVSESTTSVTVRDRPSNVTLIGRYIANLNHNLSKQVLVKVEILDIALNTAFNYGIDWTLVKRTLGTQFFLNANYGTPVSITPLVGTAPFTNPGGPNGLPQFGPWNYNNSSTGVTALVNALTQQGKVAVVTQPRVVCLNNQVSVIRITSQTGYLASVQQTALGGGSNSTSVQTSQVTSQITPGQVVTGLTLYILPKILGKKVFLQVNADLSTLIQIQSISSAGNGAPTAGSSAPIIQVPQLSQKQFNQRAVIGSGDTLILSGFRQIKNQSGAMQFLDNQAVGGKAAQQENSESIVLITPIVLPGYA